MKKIAVVGYGNLGKGVELAAKHFSGIELEYIFTRRNTNDILPYFKETKVLPYAEILNYKSELDCLILAGGSRSDLVWQSPELAGHFNIVDSFDNHADIKKHIADVDCRAKQGRKLALLSFGWDPGLFSLLRLYLNAFMPKSAVNTFWGMGVSQGHSDALRRINGVQYAVQYTVPKAEAVSKARAGEAVSPSSSHKRICYIVAEQGREGEITENINSMENYFSGYEIEIHFISEREFFERHTALPHRGEVIASGFSGINNENRTVANFSLELESNPEFTAGVLLAAAKAACKLAEQGEMGVKTVFDVPPKYFFEEGALSFL